MSALTDRVQCALQVALKDPLAVDTILTQLDLVDPLTFADITETVDVDQLPTTGLALDQSTSIVTTATDAATVTFNCSLSNWHKVTLASSRIFALSNVADGQEITLMIVQGSGGSKLVTWFSTITWAGGAAPTLTTAATKTDIVRLKQTAAGAYLGWVVGQNF